MIWNNLNIRTKIATGYSFILFLLVLMAIITLANFQRIDSEGKVLANNYIPSTSNSSKLDRYWHEMEYYIQLYSTSHNESYYKKAEQRLVSLELTLGNLIKLSEGQAELKDANNNFKLINLQLSDFKVLIKKYNETFGKYIQNNIKVNEIKNKITSSSENGQNGGNSYLGNRCLYYINESFINIFNDYPRKLIPINNQINNLINESGSNNQSNQQYLECLMSLKNQNISFIDAKVLELKRVESSNLILAEIMGLTEIGLDKIIEMGENNSQIIQKGRNILIINILIILVIASVSIYMISNSIAKPINEGVMLANRIANGDLTHEIKVKGKDEVGILLSALNKMTENLSDLMSKIKTSAMNLAGASNQMNSSALMLSQGASEHASSSEEISAAMEEIHSNIIINTENANTTKKIALTAAKGILESTEVSKQAVLSLKEIAEKVSIIDDIAFQTNLLALNAAVEAARAGHLGKGFSVVAAEVRKLAERSKTASAEINILSKENIERSNNTAEILEKISPDIINTSKLVEDIAISSQDQIPGIEHINEALKQLNNVTQQVAANSEELAANSEELASFAEQLKDLTTAFTTKDDEA